ncbi:immunity 51 family protein [Streptomyces sp. DSM 44915]|uniref:Immunity 51 family protein n=1 Tax=Streptomyces chisholmiae TaxID=3075540 RepID=A0ABU2JZ51_9ACTN|nr:immunity 51 family protein [Streptomyces sp. DSM 44915]MDT0269483.1 immunity 51 family protein [Streptomyces sp. DSM 44915]
MTDRETFAPLVLLEYSHRPGHYGLMLTDDAMFAVEGVLAEFGHESNGYAWAGIARAAVATRAPEIGERISFDPEAGMFVAYGEDAAALRTLGALLKEAYEDPAVLREFVTAGEPSSFD